MNFDCIPNHAYWAHKILRLRTHLSQAPRQWKETTAEHGIFSLETQTLDTYP